MIMGTPKTPWTDDWTWRNTALEEMESVEKSLGCPICQEFLDGASSLSTCGHTFCAECIRRALSEKNECPSCRKECSSANIVANKSMMAVVQTYQIARIALIKTLNNGHLPDGMVAPSPCPSTTSSCVAGTPKPNESKIADRVTKRMPNTVYHMTKEKDLRKMLKELNLPSQGSKEALVLRHKEYTLLFNAMLDKQGGVSKKEMKQIRTQVAEKEKTLESSKKTPSLFSKGTDGATPSLDKLEESRSFKKSYRRLVLQVLRRPGERKKHTKVRARMKNWKRKCRTNSKETLSVKRKAIELESLSLASSSNQPTKKPRMEETGSKDDSETCDHHTPPKADLEGIHWRKVYSAEHDVIIYFNSETKEIFLERPPESEESAESSGGMIKQGEIVKGEETLQQKSKPTIIDLEDGVETFEFTPTKIKTEGESQTLTPSAWSCSVCTYINSKNHSKCDMCERPRYDEESSKKSTSFSGKKQGAIVNFFTKG